ncbi:hypothetical protein F5X96DRAFT_633533 [Biscogniauxia mediterranea]|nr:hypothetical protein F5X96DRAFT_633533 [Biscogniauxia mediterranea]
MYMFSKLSLCSFIEVTCGFICLRGPTAPKAFKHLGILISIMRSRPSTLARKLISSENSN